MEGTPYWRERKVVTSSSLTKFSFTRQLPKRPPPFFWASSAYCNCAAVITPSFTKRSPIRADIPVQLSRPPRPSSARAWDALSAPRTPPPTLISGVTKVYGIGQQGQGGHATFQPRKVEW